LKKGNKINYGLYISLKDFLFFPNTLPFFLIEEQYFIAVAFVAVEFLSLTLSNVGFFGIQTLHSKYPFSLAFFTVISVYDFGSKLHSFL